MKNGKAFLLSQRTSFVSLVVVLGVLILAPYLSGNDRIQGRSTQETLQERLEDETAAKGDTKDGQTPEKRRERWDYYLSFAIAGLTAIGVWLLIYYSFSNTHGKGAEERRAALYLIVVALIIEAVLISGVIGIEVKQYESIYAAIAGYVLGTMGKQDESPGSREEQTS